MVNTETWPGMPAAKDAKGRERKFFKAMTPDGKGGEEVGKEGIAPPPRELHREVHPERVFEAVNPDELPPKDKLN